MEIIDMSEDKLKSLQITEPQYDAVSDDISDEEERVSMTLGFVEKPKHPWSLLSQYFPSKAGGTPAWLDPVNLPSEKSSICDFCGEPLQFLIQVYAPLSEESTFHRTLFVFICTSMSCLRLDQHEQWKRHPETPFRSVKVFRCQLPRANSFYSTEAPNKDGTQLPLTPGAMLCNWCGTWKGNNICGSCKRARYCSAKHQTAHWESSKSNHQVSCRQLETPIKESESAASNSHWPEYEIVNEEECDFEEISNEDGSSSSIIAKSRTDGAYVEMQTCFMGTDDNRSWASFQGRISLAPEQVLRYSSSTQAKPLWPVSGGRPSKLDIPKCNYCGGTRGFEFQVLPQLLYFFHVKDDSKDSLDWATIVVYTCEASCGGNVGYKEEFAWVQLPSESISIPEGL